MTNVSSWCGLWQHKRHDFPTTWHDDQSGNFSVLPFSPRSMPFLCLATSRACLQILLVKVHSSGIHFEVQGYRIGVKTEDCQCNFHMWMRECGEKECRYAFCCNVNSMNGKLNKICYMTSCWREWAMLPVGCIVPLKLYWLYVKQTKNSLFVNVLQHFTSSLFHVESQLAVIFTKPYEPVSPWR